MKKNILILLVFLAVNLFGQKHYELLLYYYNETSTPPVGYVYQDESLAYFSRVATDGGEIVDSLLVDSAYIFLKANSLLDSIDIWVNPNFGIKKSGSNITKMYDLSELNRDASQTTASLYPLQVIDQVSSYDAIRVGNTADVTADTSYLNFTDFKPLDASVFYIQKILSTSSSVPLFPSSLTTSQGIGLESSTSWVIRFNGSSGATVTNGTLKYYLYNVNFDSTSSNSANVTKSQDATGYTAGSITSWLGDLTSIGSTVAQRPNLVIDFIVTKNNLSTAKISAVKNYLNGVYSLY